jgi:hypothetical protein
VITLDFEFSAPLWKWEGGNWFFITLPAEMSADIKTFASEARVGFGSVRVSATIGGTEFQTSLFPSKAQNEGQGGYLLPVKASVRKAEALQAGMLCEVKLEIVP